MDGKLVLTILIDNAKMDSKLIYKNASITDFAHALTQLELLKLQLIKLYISESEHGVTQ